MGDTNYDYVVNTEAKVTKAVKKDDITSKYGDENP